jgi:hypothetical protein
MSRVCILDDVFILKLNLTIAYYFLEIEILMNTICSIQCKSNTCTAFLMLNTFVICKGFDISLTMFLCSVCKYEVCGGVFVIMMQLYYGTEPKVRKWYPYSKMTIYSSCSYVKKCEECVEQCVDVSKGEQFWIAVTQTPLCIRDMPK